MKNYLLVITTIVILASCSTARKTQRPAATTPADSVQTQTTATPTDSTVATETISTVLGKLNRINYTSFTGKMGVNYSTKGDSKSFDVKIQMQKDSLIWASVIGPLGIEVARALITKDSVQIMNRMNKQYISSSYVYLQEQLGLPLDLGTLQDLLIGNPVFIDNTNSSYSKKGDDSIQITSQTRNFRNLLTVLLPDYLPSFSKLDDVDANRNRSAALTYGDYESKNDIRFSTSRKINVKYKNDIQIQLNYKSFSFNEALSTPFSVPKGYKTKK